MEEDEADLHPCSHWGLQGKGVRGRGWGGEERRDRERERLEKRLPWAGERGGAEKRRGGGGE